MVKPKHYLNDEPLRTRHRFFLNPYADMAYTKCPKCEVKTKQRKVPLVIHVEPSNLLVLNKTCRYCERCDLLIARQAEVEPLLAAALETRWPENIGNPYLVIGTLDRTDWRDRALKNLRPIEVLDRAYVFEDVWRFHVAHGGWGPAET